MWYTETLSVLPLRKINMDEILKFNTEVIKLSVQMYINNNTPHTLFYSIYIWPDLDSFPLPLVTHKIRGATH